MSIIAAIDAGSNGIRMVVGQVDEAWEVKPLESNQMTEQNLKSYDFPEENENGPGKKEKH